MLAPVLKKNELDWLMPYVNAVLLFVTMFVVVPLAGLADMPNIGLSKRIFGQKSSAS